MKVTQEQIEILRHAIGDALNTYTAESGNAVYLNSGKYGPYWCCEIAIIEAERAPYVRKPGRIEYKPAAILALDTGLFVKGSLSSKGLRITKGQPKTPPNIDSYTLSRTGRVEGVGYPEHVFYTAISATHIDSGADAQTESPPK